MQKVIQRKILSFLRLSRFIQFWLVPLWLLLGISKLMIGTIQFQKLAGFLGQHMGITAWHPLLLPFQEQQALEISRALRLAARYTPWNSNCFPQAVAARCLLGLYRIPYALYFGLQRDPQSTQMKAHTWVVAGKVYVTGGVSFDQFTIVGCFVSAKTDSY